MNGPRDTYETRMGDEGNGLDPPKRACPWSRSVSAIGWSSLLPTWAMPTGSMGRSARGDLMMVSVLLRLRTSGILDEFPELAEYVARGEARPAYGRAFAAQWAFNNGNPRCIRVARECTGVPYRPETAEMARRFGVVGGRM
jgi:hypothetical protein